MHVFLAGSTGVVGRAVIPLLLAEGHTVAALTRQAGRARSLAGPGVTPVVADAMDAEGLAAAVRSAEPDVIMHQLTDLADADSAANAALRIHGTRNLVDAAAGVGRIVAQSIAWAYAPGAGPATEDDALDLDATGPRAATIKAVAALEAAVAELDHAVVLRYGTIYGPGTWYADDGDMADTVAERRLPRSADVTSFVHVEDAATAAVQALDWPNGPVNVCDDEPATATDWVPIFCEAIGAPPPPPAGADERTPWARGADNRLARARGWTPRYPWWREGFETIRA